MTALPRRVLNRLYRDVNSVACQLFPRHMLSKGKGCQIDRTARFEGQLVSILLGQSVVVEAGAILNCPKRGSISIGDGSSIGRYACINTGSDGRLLMGAKSSVNAFCYLQCDGGLDIGNDVHVGPNVSFFTVNHRFADPNRPIKDQGIERRPIKVHNNVWIGGGAIILPGVEIGSGSVVAAGSLVTRSVSAGSIVAGLPAKPISTSASQ